MKVTYSLLLIILGLAIAGLMLYYKYPGTPRSQQADQVCITVMTKAHHPTFPFIKKEFGTPCAVPEGWVRY
jgi:hypothetical protein